MVDCIPNALVQANFYNGSNNTHRAVNRQQLLNKENSFHTNMLIHKPSAATIGSASTNGKISTKSDRSSCKV